MCQSFVTSDKALSPVKKSHLIIDFEPNFFIIFFNFFNCVNISANQVLAKTAGQVLKMLMLLGLTLYVLHPQKKSHYLPFTHLHLPSRII